MLCISLTLVGFIRELLETFSGVPLSRTHPGKELLLCCADLKGFTEIKSSLNLN